MIPEPQLLRWKDWFSRYKFTVQHIKGKHNTIADFLSRPPKPIHLITPQKILPLFSLTMAPPIPLPITTAAKNKEDFPPFFSRPTNTTDIQAIAQTGIHFFRQRTLKNTDYRIPQPFFNPETPYLTIPQVYPRMTEDHAWHIWCLAVLYTIPLEISPLSLYQHLNKEQAKSSIVWTILEWFKPLIWWRSELQRIIQNHKIWEKNLAEQQKIKSIFIVHKPYFMPRANLLLSSGYAWEYYTTLDYPSNVLTLIPTLHGFLKECNNYIPKSTLHTSLGPFPGEFIPGEPRLPDIDIPDIPVQTHDSQPTSQLAVNQAILNNPALFQDSQPPYDSSQYYQPSPFDLSHLNQIQPSIAGPSQSPMDMDRPTDEELEYTAWVDEQERKRKEKEKSNSDIENEAGWRRRHDSDSDDNSDPNLSPSHEPIFKDRD